MLSLSDVSLADSVGFGGFVDIAVAFKAAWILRASVNLRVGRKAGRENA